MLLHSHNFINGVKANKWGDGPGKPRWTGAGGSTWLSSKKLWGAVRVLWKIPRWGQRLVEKQEATQPPYSPCKVIEFVKINASSPSRFPLRPGSGCHACSCHSLKWVMMNKSTEQDGHSNCDTLRSRTRAQKEYKEQWNSTSLEGTKVMGGSNHIT